MPNYPGRRKGTRRVTIFLHGKQTEWIVEGSKREADAFEARKRLELEAGSKPSTRTAPSFASFCVEVYTPHAKQHLKASTWGKVRRYQVETLVGFFGSHKLTEMSVELVEAYKKARLATVHKGRKVKETSVNNELRVLRTILGWARELQQYPVAEPFKIKMLRTRGSSRVKVWTAQEIGRLFAAARARAPDLLPMLVFIANTGVRKGEAIACEWSWIDGDMLRIPSNDAWQPKNGKPREVPISRALAAALAGPRRHPTVVFPNRRGERYACFPEETFRDAREAAGLRGSPHTLRHSFASMFLAARPDMFLLAQLMGHSHERVTELYSHLLPEHLDRARDAVDLGPAPEPEAPGELLH